ncbi:MAG TPA: SRPBCC domain-containing protein [Burkholderiales bacterium]|nr:SRPBCC domain-containing protein [Burkholderiales bacterium]
MPQREARFTVNAQPPELWKFIRDMESLCTCIPGVEKIVLLDGRSADLTVKEKVGVIPMVLTLRASIDSEDPPRRLHATARAEHLTMNIDVSLEKAANGTELRALFDVTGTGQLKPIVDRLFEKRATERAAQFADSLQKRFGAVPPARAAAQAPAGSLSRFWRRLLEWFTPRRN